MRLIDADDKSCWPIGKESKMNADEVVSALRCCNRPKGHRCSECPVFSRYEHRICKATVDRFAADLIESLQARLVEHDALATEYGIDGKTMLTLAKSQLRTAQDNIKLREQLAASQRREMAAVADFEGCMKNKKERCAYCIHDDECEPGESLCYANVCGFEWRGPQEAGEEATE